MPNEEIFALRDCFVRTLDPLRIYLFGSYASGIPNEDSDLDFYIIVDDDPTSPSRSLSLTKWSNRSSFPPFCRYECAHNTACLSEAP